MKIIIFLLNILIQINLYSHVPDEYNSSGGYAMGFGYGGSTSFSSIDSIRLNPAMIAYSSKYVLSFTHNSPRFGRDFYQVGVLDSKNPLIAAALLYTGFFNPYDNNLLSDSPINRRVQLGLAKKLKLLSVGMNINYIEKEDDSFGVKNITIGLGISTKFTNNFTLGLSANNLLNKNVADYAHRTYRIGSSFSYSFLNLNLDYYHKDKEKKYIIASGYLDIKNIVKLMTGFRQNIFDSKRGISGGIILNHSNLSLSYMIDKDFDIQDAHHSFNLSISLKV